jgi:hypothetical protein
MTMPIAELKTSNIECDLPLCKIQIAKLALGKGFEPQFTSKTPDEKL